MTWHAETDALDSYARGTIDEASAFSIEAHLLSCSTCRKRVTGLADEERLERVWTEVEELVDAPIPGPVERILLRCGVSDHVARLLAATPSLTLSWFAAIAAALAFAGAAAQWSERGVLLFLALAPLLPLAGVAAAYGPALDPSYEIGVAAPIRSFRLLLIRSAAVLVSTTALTAVAALALPGLDWRVAAWLLPALGLTTASLALATYVSPPAAFGWLAFLWIAVITLTSAAAQDDFVAFRAPGQTAFLIATIGAAVVVARRREAFDTGRHT
jgi:hypothetical protein